MTEQSILFQWRGRQAEQGLLYQKPTLSLVYFYKKTTTKTNTVYQVKPTKPKQS